METKTYPKRRIFINKGDQHLQIFSFNQDKDGSVYCSSPDFADAKWISYQRTPQGPQIITTEAVGTGKLSVHGSGVTAIRNNTDPAGHKLRIKGNNLLDLQKKARGHDIYLRFFLKNLAMHLIQLLLTGEVITRCRQMKNLSPLY